jgi:hypothetical protein
MAPAFPGTGTALSGGGSMYPSCSNACAARSTVLSSQWRPTSIIPTGRFSGSCPGEWGLSSGWLRGVGSFWPLVQNLVRAGWRRSVERAPISRCAGNSQVSRPVSIDVPADNHQAGPGAGRDDQTVPPATRSPELLAPGFVVFDGWMHFVSGPGRKCEREELRSLPDVRVFVRLPRGPGRPPRRSDRV